MKKLFVLALAVALTALLLAQNKAGESGLKKSPVGYRDTPVLPGQKWKVHDIDRPRPRQVTPGATPGAPPSDAIVLFGGKDLSQWENVRKGETSPAAWTIGNGYFEVKGGTGDLVTKQKFGDVQLHIEWSAPTKITAESQLRGNSGVLLMQRYEVQVLDCWNNLTYADGQAASIYGQYPPLKNACRPPGEWNVYDIVFEAPKFEGSKVVKQANATVFHNGVLMHNRKEWIGRMAHRVVGTYAPHGAEEPLALQDHGDPVRFRNIWIRRLQDYDQP
ncbi:MAG: DUF1080 domain-containing protein [Bryobacterales bacterium]|nr:DUF1080 domain-containing protein [Bryobacterales bacterium]